jgi:hypothetical protein
VGTGTKEDEWSTGRVWAAVFHYVTASYHLASFWNLWTAYFWYWICGYGASILPISSYFSVASNMPNDLKFLPRQKSDLQSCGMLSITEWYIATNVLGQPFGPKFTGQAIQKRKTLRHTVCRDGVGSDWLTQNMTLARCVSEVCRTRNFSRGKVIRVQKGTLRGLPDHLRWDRCCPETSVNNDESMLHDISEERRPHIRPHTFVSSMTLLCLTIHCRKRRQNKYWTYHVI